MILQKCRFLLNEIASLVQPYCPVVTTINNIITVVREARRYDPLVLPSDVILHARAISEMVCCYSVVTITISLPCP